MWFRAVLSLVFIVSVSRGLPTVRATELAIRAHRFTVNDEEKFLLGISYYGALGASRGAIESDLSDMQRYGFNWLRVWANWSFSGHSVSAVDSAGNPREPYLEQLKWLVDQCDRRGIIVDVTLTRNTNESVVGNLPTLQSHLRAVETLVTSLKPYRNWYLDLANERNVRDARFVSVEELRVLRERVRELSPGLLVTASDGGDIERPNLAEYLSTVRVDFIAPHRGRSRDIHRETTQTSHQYLAWMKELGRVVPVHYQEPFRRGYSPQRWEPKATDFALDLRNAIAGGAAGWCFHNGDQKDRTDSEPRRSFDMSQRRLLEQLDEEERSFMQKARDITNRLRVIIETDAGGDPDDEQSLVRFLLYSNEWDVEGIVCNRENARERENLNPARSGLGIVQRQLNAYEECFPNLSTHDVFYPTPDELRRRTVAGYSDRDDGVNLILRAVDSSDPRPIWFMNWGTDHGSAPSSLKRALDDVLAKKGKDGYERFKAQLRISGDDRYGDHATKMTPPFSIWVNTQWPEIDGRRWYRRFGPLTATAGGFDLARDVLKDHGPLGALYPTNTTTPQKEGDTSEFLYLVPTGMNDPENPTWGSWAGRYGPNENFPDRRVFWANQADRWQGTTHRENSLSRWAADLQNDFKARMDWCVAEFAAANHPPTPVINGVYGKEILHLSASPGSLVKLDAAGTFDVDGQELTYQWFFYPEAGTYPDAMDIPNSSSSSVELSIPTDSLGKSIHVIVSVRDQGEPALTRYRRAIVHVSAVPKDRTQVSIELGKWNIDGQVTYPGTPAEGLLMNVRMVNAVFEDRNPGTCPKGFDANANTERFVSMIPDYVRHGIRAFTICLQGGSCGYEGAINSAFHPDGSLRESYLNRVSRVIEACDANRVAVILGCYYQRQDQILEDEQAVRAGIENVTKWISSKGYKNVILEIANEFSHGGFDHRLLKSAEGEKELIQLAKKNAPALLVSSSGVGNGKFPESTAAIADVLLVHFNNTRLEDIPSRIAGLKKFGKAIVCNEDDKLDERGAKAAELSVTNGASWGFMHVQRNQHYPFTFEGAKDDPTVYDKLKSLTEARDYFPPPESQGGWRKLVSSEEIRTKAGMATEKLEELKEWLLNSDKRDFAAVVIRNGYLVLEVERGNSAATDARRVASVSKAICATVLAIASEQSRQGPAERRMTFDDRAFEYIPWAKPLSDPRKSQITVRQLLNHTSGICPEATGAKNDGDWSYVLGHSGDPRTEKLAFDPGTASGYSTHAFCHAALVCETVAGRPYDQFAIDTLFKPIGCEHWWFQYYEGDDRVGRHPSHGLGMPARDLARIAYCMLKNGKWKEQSVIPEWFVVETAKPTHEVRSPELRWKLNPRVFSHGWELPALHWPESGRSPQGIPVDARYKPGSGGQLIAFVPSLDLVIARQTGGSGSWEYEEFLKRACAAVGSR
jgi:CubicO group peptidase (beta-lactamase class C family)